MFTTQDNNPDSHVPAEPVRAHVADLITAGLTPTLIAHLAGIDTRRVHVLLDDRTERGTVRTGEHRLTWRIAEAILAIPIPEGMFILATGPVRRLRALVRIGHSFDAIAAELDGLGYTGQDLAELALGEPEVIDAELAGRLADLFDRWHFTPGDSDDARELGRRHRFAAPLSWAVDDDDEAGSIDDPGATPVGLPVNDDRQWRKVEPDFPDVVADHRALGHFDEDIAEALGLSLNTFAKRLHRAGISERRRGTGDHMMIRPIYGARYSLRLPGPGGRAVGARRRMAGLAS